MDRAAFVSSSLSASLSPPPPILFLPVLLPPPDPDPSCHLIEIEEEDTKRCQGSVVSFSEEKKTKDRSAFVSSASSATLSPLFSLFSSFPFYSPRYPSPPLPRCVYCFVVPDGLISPSVLLPLLRCIVGGSSAGSLNSSFKRLIIMSHVMLQDQ